MSNTNDLTNISKMGLAELKRTAKSLNIPGNKDWDEDQWRKAINNRRRNKSVARVVDDMASAIPEGFARIEVQSTNEEEKETPIQCSVNDFVTMIPKGIVVDVPIEIVSESLENSTDYITRTKIDKEGHEVKTRIQVQAYPFREYGRNAGKSVIKPSTPRETQSVREKFREIFGKWPRREEQKEFEVALRRKKFESMMTDSNVSVETSAILESKTKNK
jgi:hypothetical protein